MNAKPEAFCAGIDLRAVVAQLQPFMLSASDLQAIGPGEGVWGGWG